jgi:alkylation response protein AidB-like acyl-CoA dehydrogenase
MADDLAGRRELVRWLAARPSDYFAASPELVRGLERRAGPDRLARMQPRLAEFGRAMGAVVEPAAATLERHRERPALLGFDGVGRSVQAIDFDPTYHEAGRAIWASGLLVADREGEGAFETAALFYLLSHAGEGGHACPVVCTLGLARAVEHHGTAEQRRQAAGLRSTDYDTGLRGSQFLTEVQGGSDVGANVVAATSDPDLDGAWRVHGEKWFCSVADADLFCLTARPEGAVPGTRGLGCFLVPRLVDGTPNGFRIRRLKDKLGTRAMASAEIEFDGALAWPLGPLDAGFKVAVEDLLNTSRWLNAVGSTGIMHRAYLEAAAYARTRHAFGVPIATFPTVAETLAVMRTEEAAALASTLALTGLVDALDRGQATEQEAAVHRVLVNVNKYATSLAATAVVHQGIEVLGGNGTIEDFCCLPRLYRDNIVYESWEGSHGVLCAQVLRDLGRDGRLDHLMTWVKGELATARAQGTDTVAQALDEVGGRLAASVADPVHGARHIRRQVDQLARVVQGACLVAGAAPGQASEAAAALFVRRHLVPGHDPERDPTWPDLVASLTSPAGD